MKFYTIQMSKARKLDIPLLDVTVKSGRKEFAPTWSLVWGIKNGTLTEEKYTESYYSLMRSSYKQNRKVWDEVLAQDELLVACYCRADKFCHRYLLADIFQELGAEYLGELG